MRIMNLYICLLAIGSTGIASDAVAQSLPEALRRRPVKPFDRFVPAYADAPSADSWQGFYLKPSIGYNSVAFSGGQLNKASGVNIGASGGYDFRFGQIVIGPKADLNYDFQSGSESAVNGVFGYRPRLDFDGSVGARAGVLWDRTLVYATGGYAFAGLNIRNDVYGFSESHTLSGWSAGGGLEYLYNEKNSFRIEYRRVQFQNASFTTLPSAQNQVNFNLDKFEIGFVHRF